MDMDEVVVEAHVGWRDELWDATPRLQLGAEFARGAAGLEVNGGFRLDDNDFSGHFASREVQHNDASWFALRDDLLTAGILAVWRPFERAHIGPCLGIGGEFASTRTVKFDDNLEGWVEGRSDPYPTAWGAWRMGVEARVERVGLRLTLGNKFSWLRRPEMSGPAERVVFVDIWRVGIDVLVRVR